MAPTAPNSTTEGSPHTDQHREQSDVDADPREIELSDAVDTYRTGNKRKQKETTESRIKALKPQGVSTLDTRTRSTADNILRSGRVADNEGTSCKTNSVGYSEFLPVTTAHVW